MATAQRKGKLKFVRQLSPHLRYGTKQHREALLEWVNQEKFDDRKPTADELIKECLRKRSGMYGLIEADERQAANIYRRLTAQDILRHIDVVQIDLSTREVIGEPIRAWVPIICRDNRGRISEDGYAPGEHLRRDIPEMREARESVLQRAFDDLDAWYRRYQRYNQFLLEFDPVIQAYRELRDKRKEERARKEAGGNGKSKQDNGKG